MLYDPKWKRESVADLIDWLETQDPAQAYNYGCCSTCLIAQWMAGTDKITWPDATRGMYHGSDKYKIAAGPNCAVSEWTYGAALARARRALAEQENA